MTTAIATAPTFNRPDTGRALRNLRLAHRDSPPELRAINKAALNLEANPWQWDAPTGRLTIESSSEPGHRVYHVSAAGCDCPAGIACIPCWHVAAWRILTKAQQLAELSRAPKVRPTFDALTAEVDTWFA